MAQSAEIRSNTRSQGRQLADSDLLGDHSAAIEQVRLLCESPVPDRLDWIHQQSCKFLLSTYRVGLQKLTGMLNALLRSGARQEHVELALKPALDNILDAICHGRSFIESCRSPLDVGAGGATPGYRYRASFLVSHPLSFHGSSDLLENEPIADRVEKPWLPAIVIFLKGLQKLSRLPTFLSRFAAQQCDELALAGRKAWLLKVLLKGLAKDAMDVHLEEFLVAFWAVSAAVQELERQHSQPRLSRFVKDPPPSPEAFWKSEQNNLHHVLLVSAHQIDQVKQSDENFLHSQLEQITSLRESAPVCKDAAPAPMPVDDVPQLAAVVREKIRWSKEPFQNSLCFLDNKNQEKVGCIKSSHSSVINKVVWLNKEFALKLDNERILTEEAKIHVRLNHPNVVHAIALCKGEQKVQLSLLVDLMDENLHDFLEKHASSLSLQEKVRIMLHIAKGMAHIHEKGVIHRDLKPQNVFVRMSSMNKSCSKGDTPAALAERHWLESVQVADFGLSRSITDTTSDFSTKRLGTNHYRAPEVLNKNSPTYKRSADVFSFAMTCFKLLDYREPSDPQPHQGDASTWEDWVQAGGRPDLKKISNAACPPYLKHCLTTWWAQDPKNRHSFNHICCVLRHLDMCLARCGDDMHQLFKQFPFLAWPFSTWKRAQDIAQKKLEEFYEQRNGDDWKNKGYRCGCTRVNEIPYEMHVMNWAIKEAESKSLGDKVSEFFSFFGNISPSNHEAFHRDIVRRNASVQRICELVEDCRNGG